MRHPRLRIVRSWCRGVLVLRLPALVWGQPASGAELHRSACTAGHGEDGQGRSPEDVGFSTPLPVFSDCSFASRDPDPDWFAVVHEGGPVRAFYRMMPAVGDALSAVEIDATPRHVRTFCSGDAWSRGALEESAARTAEYLRSDTAQIGGLDIAFDDTELVVDVALRNLAEQELPTAYPSRRAWLHLTVRGRGGATLFESGAMRPDDSIAGNDNDTDPRAFEPHYVEFSAPDQGQIYESVTADDRGEVSTSLLRGVRDVKDNRLLPAGFDKTSASDGIAERCKVADDVDSLPEQDTVRYRVTLDRGVPAVTESARLMFQTIEYRWARNLADYAADETDRFVGYYEANAMDSTVVPASAEAQGRRVDTRARRGGARQQTP